MCKRCTEEKPISEYHYSNREKQIFQPYCKICSAVNAREYRQKNRDYVAKYKMSKGCEICGFKAEHHCQFDLHHVDPKTKSYKGSHKSYDAGWSRDRIDNEISKCMVVCKNCHALESHNQGHWRNSVTDISMRQSSAQ